MKSDAEKFQPLGPAIRKEQPPAPPPVVKRQTSVPQQPLNIADMDMIRKDFGNSPPPWGIFSRAASWGVEYYPVVRFKAEYFRGCDEG